MPLFGLRPELRFESYEEMGEYVFEQLKERYNGHTIGMVIGKVSDANPQVMEDNLDDLYLYSVGISRDKGYVMVNLASFQPAINYLMDKFSEDYAEGFLVHVTLPLINKKVVTKVFCKKKDHDISMGTLRELGAATDNDALAGYLD